MISIKNWLGIVSLACSGIVFAGDQPADTGIIGPVENLYIARTDCGTPAVRGGTTYQGKSNSWIKKQLDMSGIEQKEWNKIDKVYISVYMYAFSLDKNGLNETFDIIINGHVNTFPTSCGIGNSSSKISWFDFAIPKKQLIRGKNSIIIRKSKGTKDNDDYIYVGINSEQAKNCSLKSSDSGNTWNKAGLNGRGYMIRMKLFMPDCKVLLSQEQKLVSYDLNPPVKELTVRQSDQAASYKRSANTIELQNSYMSLLFGTKEHLNLISLIHKAAGVDMLASSKSAGQLFLLEINGRRFYAKDLKLIKVKPISKDKQVVLEFHFTVPGQKLLVKFLMKMGAEPNVECDLSIDNFSSKTVSVKTAFPLLSGICWSKDLNNKDYYLFPYSGGLIAPLPGRFQTSYGAGSYIQLLTSYCPSQGGGVYLRANDKSGSYKILILNKKNKTGKTIDELFATGKIINKIKGHVEKEYILGDPLPDVIGTSMAFTYLKRELAPTQKWKLPSATIAMINGDWHKAMQEYRQWFRSWSYKRPWPSKVAGRFRCLGTWPKHYHNAKGYSQSYLPKYRNDSIAELYGWWEHMKLTPENIKEFKNLAMKQAGKKWLPWKNRQAEGYLFGNCGDYGSQGYNKRWGGAAAFKKHILATKAKGIMPILYTEGILADVCTEVGQKNGQKWGVVKKDGTYLWAYKMWNMCVDCPGWGRYLADTCERLLRDTACDGIRFDQFGHAGWVCYSKKHAHKFALPGHNAWIQAEADICRQVRKAMNRVDETAILMTEYPGHDVMSQYLDACISYDFYHHEESTSYQPVFTDLFRFYFPECKIYELTFRWHPKAFTSMIFSGLALFGSYSEEQQALLKENAQAFDSVDITPLIPTLARKVYVNRFQGKDKTIYTILNTNKNTVKEDLMNIPLPGNYHVVNVINGTEISTQRNSKGAVVKMDITPDKFYCIGVFPKTISVKVENGKTIVKINKNCAGYKLKIVSSNGKELFSRTIHGDKREISVPENIEKGIIKLYKKNELWDITDL